jgi:hypothetical protein
LLTGKVFINLSALLNRCFFMEISYGKSKGDEDSSGGMFKKLLRLMDELSGNRQNLKVNVKELRLRLGKTRVEFSGEVNLDILYSKEE